VSNIRTRGEHISLNRKHIGLKQGELAKIIGVHVTTLRRWERDAGEPRVSDLKILCKILRISESDITNAPGKERKPFHRKAAPARIVQAEGA
jgi:transcriptional regulator with XRE-family HTH domain